MTPPPAEQFAARIFMGPALRAQPDRRLVDLVRDGYDAAFEEIVRRYRRQLDRFAAAIVGGRSEDVTQDAFSKALLALRGSEAEVELRPWLYRIVRNTALNDLRDRAPATDELPEEGLPGGRSAAAEAEAREELTDLMQRLRSLPEPQRAAIVMRELEGLSHEEIAAALGVTGGAARQVIFRARAALRDGLGLLIPVPLVRALAEHGGEAGRAGGAIAAGASASSAGGAALGGLGGGALKAGMATVLIAGAVGAGVAVEHHKGDRPGAEAADAAPLVRDAQRSSGGEAPGGASTGSSLSRGSEDRGHGRGGSGADDRGGHGEGGSQGGSLSPSSGSGPGDGPLGSGDDSNHSGGGSGSSGPGPSSGSGSSGGDHHGGSGSSGSGGSGSGRSGSDDSAGGDHSGSLNSGDGGGGSGGGGSDDGISGGPGGGSDDSGSGSGEITEPTPAPPVESSDDGSNSGSGSGSGGSGSGKDSGGDLGGSGSGGLDGSSIVP